MQIMRSYNEKYELLYISVFIFQALILMSNDSNFLKGGRIHGTIIAI